MHDGKGELEGQMQGAWRFYVPELHYHVWYGAVEMGQRSNLGRVVIFNVNATKAGISTSAHRGSRLRGNDEKGRSESSTFSLTTAPRWHSFGDRGRHTGLPLPFSCTIRPEAAHCLEMVAV